MGEIDKCPTCGALLDETRYCYKCCYTVPSDDVLDKPENEEDLANNFSCCENSKSDAQQNISVCPNCGADDVSGSECYQCGKPITSIQDNSMHNLSSCCSGLLVLSKDCSIKLEDETEYVIGRESCVTDIRNFLCNNYYISRYHCTIKLNLSSKSVIIKDCNSKNGTFVNNGCQRIEGEQLFSLPLNIWLGSKTNTRVEIFLN